MFRAFRHTSTFAISSDGTKLWYRDGKRHREDGPAVEFADGTKMWLRNGELHREDGPAVTFPCGAKEWWLNGKSYRRTMLA